MFYQDFCPLSISIPQKHVGLGERVLLKQCIICKEED